MPGPPVVLVHGFATSARRTWHETGWVDILGDSGREVVTIDLLGHGEADKPHEAEAYADLEGHVAAHMPDGPVDAVGFSLGARTLLVLAGTEPDRFRRLVVAGVGANLFRDDGAEHLANAISGVAGGDDPVAHHFAQLASEPGSDLDALTACARRPHAPLTASTLAAVTVPTLVVLGDQDFAGPPDPLVDALPDASLVTLRGVDHFATPKAFPFIDAALDFLA